MFELLEPSTIIRGLGVIGVIAIIFAESGLLIGFFLPGDSLLFTAGFLASQGYLNFWVLLFGTTIAAIVGDNVGYAFGKKVGPAIFTKEDSIFFNKEYVAKAQHFYEKHGKKTIILARFMPVIRTFAPIVAGVGNMHYKTFFTYNVVGGIIWASGLTTLGYVLGNVIPNVDRYIVPLVIAIIIISFLPGVYHIIKARKEMK